MGVRVYVIIIQGVLSRPEPNMLFILPVVLFCNS